MGLAIGDRLGSYEVLGSIGAGGMGEVYRARDARLKRDVALKILAESFAADPDRLARFQREAEVLASLNHSNIAQIYGIEDSNGTRALVMELVDGETLSDRIARGPIPLDEALPIAKQIAEALEAAHEQGIVHRDLKPANVKVRDDGTVKVLDFGLAKLSESSGGARKSDLSLSPTITSPAMTGVGVLLGTAAYMSPEQAKGRPADKRSDVWAFGCVLFEMLSGRPAFEGEDVSDTLANVLKAHPNWSALPSTVPEPIRALLRACLEKDRRERIADSAAAILILRDPTFRNPAAAAPQQPVWPRVLPIAAAGLVVAAVAGALGWRVKPAPVPPVTRFEVALGNGQEFAATAASRRLIAISADGSQIAYVANARIYVRSLSQLEARSLASTEDARGVQNPVFSPDGKWIAFYSVGDRALKRVAVTGGATVNLCATDGINGLTWGDSGIVFSVFNQGVMRVDPAGGAPETLVDIKSGEAVVQPQLLPGGRSMLLTLANQRGVLDFDRSKIVVQSLATGDRKTLIEAGSDAWYLPTGHILYALGGVLWAVPFDLERLQVTGGPISMIEGVARGIGAVGLATAQFSVSNSGSLAYIPGPPTPSGGQRTLVSIDRTGAVQPLRRQGGGYQSVRVSPDGSRLAMVIDDGKDVNVWIDEVAGGSSMRRLTFEGRNRYPIWSGDGHHVIFQSDREGDLGIWWQPADGSGPAERLTRAERGAAHIPESWMPREQLFSFSIVASPGNVSLWTFSIPARKAAPFDGIRSTAPLDSVYSPDGRWLAYTQRAPGVAGVFVQPVPPSGAKYQVAENGHHPLWSPDGLQLLYFPGADRLASVRVSTQPSFTVANAEQVPGGPISTTSSESGRNHDFAPDGRIIALFTPSQMPGSGPATQRIEVVLNWFQELQARAPAK